MAQGQEEDLQAILDREIGWRRKELVDLKRQTESSALVVLQRASIALAYAHYEGFVKQSLFAVSRFINQRRLASSTVKSALLSTHFKSLIDNTHKSKVPAYFVDAIELLRDQKPFRVKVDLKKHLENIGNLDHANLVSALRCVGIDTVPLQNLKQFIDEALLARRNLIAHGEYVELSREEALDVVERVVGLLGQIKTLIENMITLRSYLEPIPRAETSTATPPSPQTAPTLT